MKVLITLKGLKPGEDNFIESQHEITGIDIDEINAKIASFIYEYRNTEQYYKIKYTAIQEVME